MKQYHDLLRSILDRGTEHYQELKQAFTMGSKSLLITVPQVSWKQSPLIKSR